MTQPEPKPEPQPKEKSALEKALADLRVKLGTFQIKSTSSGGDMSIGTLLLLLVVVVDVVLVFIGGIDPKLGALIGGTAAGALLK